MTVQSEIDFGKALKGEGMQRAIDHADQVHESWSEKAFEFLKEFIKTHKKFVTEDVRFYSDGKIPTPPNARAWGGVVRRAVVDGLIRRVAYDQAKSAKSHCANVSVWAVN